MALFGDGNRNVDAESAEDGMTLSTLPGRAKGPETGRQEASEGFFPEPFTMTLPVSMRRKKGERRQERKISLFSF